MYVTSKNAFRNEEIAEQQPLHLNFLSDSSRVGSHQFDITPDKNLLNVKWVNNPTNEDVVFHVHSRDPFFVSKDRFSISHDPSTKVTTNHTFRIQVDSGRRTGLQENR